MLNRKTSYLSNVSIAKMGTKKEILYLLQVAGVFTLLAVWRTPYLFVIPALIVLALPFPSSRGLLVQAWQGLGHLLGKLVSPLVLSAAYYLGLTPLAWIRRFGGSDELNLKRPAASTLVPVSERTDLGRFDDLW